ncbi:hypothetical protein D8674_005432 [Pyrus ussuriensis x Pyrus communis]|uniref:Uncharacterized protein n=1 Tax=Pyrus ussuriensis x Pyrus communis TaxID=2448454 RepID=A0A5N5FRH4_9ROSA|nr:hypothetical protein D8674_005432 [Pyrus ussuriensis x Pyrus communis]
MEPEARQMELVLRARIVTPSRWWRRSLGGLDKIRESWMAIVRLKKEAITTWMLWEIDEQEKELFKQGKEMFNLQKGENEMDEDEDEERRMRDDEARSQIASHSCQVIQVVVEISRPIRSANIDRSRQRRGAQNDLDVLT